MKTLHKSIIIGLLTASISLPALATSLEGGLITIPAPSLPSMTIKLPAMSTSTTPATLSEIISSINDFEKLNNQNTVTIYSLTQVPLPVFLPGYSQIGVSLTSRSDGNTVNLEGVATGVQIDIAIGTAKNMPGVSDVNSVKLFKK